MTEREERELQELAEMGRKLLPKEFFAFNDSVDTLVRTGVLRPKTRTRDGSEESWSSRIGLAALEQLRMYLYTDDGRYKDVRAKGKSLARSAVQAIAAYIAGAFGLTVGVATAAVAFLALAITRIGVGTFCELTNRPNN